MIDDTPEPTTPTTTSPTPTPPPVRKAHAPKKKKDTPGMRLDKRPTVTIQELCAEIGVNCTVARKKMRDAGEKKSLYGVWEWMRNSPEYKKVRKLLTR
jgi:hypothetical protein